MFKPVFEIHRPCERSLKYFWKICQKRKQHLLNSISKNTWRKQLLVRKEQNCWTVLIWHSSQREKRSGLFSSAKVGSVSRHLSSWNNHWERARNICSNRWSLENKCEVEMERTNFDQFEWSFSWNSGWQIRNTPLWVNKTTSNNKTRI